MFKRRSSTHPTTPKLASVALPETFSPPINISYTLDIQPAPNPTRGGHRTSTATLSRTVSQNRVGGVNRNSSTASFFSRFRSSPALSTGSGEMQQGYGSYPVNQAPRYPSGQQPRYGGQVARRGGGSDTSDEDDDEDEDGGVYHKQILPNVVAIRDGKKLSKEDQMEWDEEERRIVELARRHPNARITLAKSKARIEEEREREEEQQARRQQRDREARERDYNESLARAKAKETEDMDDPFARRAARAARKAAEEEERRREREQREMEEGKKRAQRQWEESQRVRKAVGEREEGERERERRERALQERALQEQRERQERERQQQQQMQQQQERQMRRRSSISQQQPPQQQPTRMRSEFPSDVQGPHQPQPRARPVKGILKPTNGPTTPAPPQTFGGGPSPAPSEEAGGYGGEESGYASSHQPQTQAQLFKKRNSLQAQSNYHSDSEGYRQPTRGHRASTFSYGTPPAPPHPQRAYTYPLDPRSSSFAPPPPSYPTQPPSSYTQPQRRESSRSRSGSDSHSRSRSGSHSQIETDVETDSERLAYHNALLNKNHNRQGPGMPSPTSNGGGNGGGRSRNASFSGGLPPNLNGMSISVPQMTGYGQPQPQQPQAQQQPSRYMKPYQKSPQPQWWWPRDAFNPESVHTAQTAAWDPPTLPWMLTDPNKRVVDAKHPPQPIAYFDIAFDPRMREFEVKCMRPGEPRLTPLSRDEETKIASGMAAPTMIIVNDAYPSWTVVVRAKKGNCRVCEVFRAIYDTYAVTLTQQEMASIPPSKMQGVMAAFKQRCEDGPGLPPVEMNKGLRRVDVLRSERFFRGLEYVSGAGLPLNLWKLQLEKIT